jgi:FkbM family methyltransferase
MTTAPPQQIGQLDFIELRLASGGMRRFFYRATSRTDRSVIQQIFEAQHYNLAQLPRSKALKEYALLVAAGGASLLVVDAGANIGASAVYLTQLDSRIHVCAIEPEPGNFSVLEANSTGLPITPIKSALANKSGKRWLTDPGLGEWGFRTGEQAGNLQVTAVTMDDILGTFDLPHFQPLICKIDIEGGESDLFSANDSWMDRFPLIIIELHDWMLPGQASSKSFLRAVSKRNFDLFFRGENTFCFNNELLGGER